MNYIVRSILMAIFLWPAAAQATPPCSNPSGDEGDQVYNTTYHVMQYCNGTNWVAMGSVMNTGDNLGNRIADGTLNMSGHPIHNLADPANAQDAATKNYTDTKISKSGGAMTGFLSLSGLPTANEHAASKEYVDTVTASASSGGNKAYCFFHVRTGYAEGNAPEDTTLAYSLIGGGGGAGTGNAGGGGGGSSAIIVDEIPLAVANGGDGGYTSPATSGKYKAGSVQITSGQQVKIYVGGGGGAYGYWSSFTYGGCGGAGYYGGAHGASGSGGAVAKGGSTIGGTGGAASGSFTKGGGACGGNAQSGGSGGSAGGGGGYGSGGGGGGQSGNPGGGYGGNGGGSSSGWIGGIGALQDGRGASGGGGQTGGAGGEVVLFYVSSECWLH